MSKFEDYNLAIKYKVIKLDKEKYVLLPIKLLKGEDLVTTFISENGEEIPYCLKISDLSNKYVVDSAYSVEELEYLYDYEVDSKESFEFLANYFYEDYKSMIQLIDTKNTDQDRIIYRHLIDINVLDKHDSDIIYFMEHSIPSLVMNQASVSELLDCETLEEMKLLIKKYQRRLTSLNGRYERDNVTRVAVSNGSIEYFEVNGEVKHLEDLPSIKSDKPRLIVPSDISYDGLRKYIKERIFGHDSEVDTFAQKLYMNYTAEKGEPIESVMFVGPTGTGKTDTVRAACNYLGIPMVETNASNLVPQGIKGTSLEDVLISLYENANGDLEKAQRGVVFLDEFDKLNDMGLEIKTPLKHILLTFTAGGQFPIDTDHYRFIFDSSMTNKVFAGVFDRITNKETPIGFGAATKLVQGLGTEEDIRKKIIDKKYFSQEELSRISTILAYNELSRDIKKEILLHSKSSELASKIKRYKRQFNIDLVVNDGYIDAVLDIAKSSTGMRSVYNIVKRTLNEAEKSVLEYEKSGYKKLVLTKNTATDPRNFELEK